MALDPGHIVNHRYRIIKQLGQGGFGTVYRVEDLSLNVVCAMKENLDYWAESQRQFEREARILAGLRHPNLPRVTDYFTLPAQGQYLVMDFVEGYDLQTILERIGKPLAEKQTLGWIDQICDALVYLHQQKPPIIHRDIKPANIKITPTGLAVLVDFGIAKMYQPDTHTTLGAQGVTPGYSPVEQHGEGITDTRTDQYALGATLYTLLTAQKPAESISRVTGMELAPPSEINPNVSPHVELCIYKAMAVMAPDRFPSVKVFKEALKDPGLAAQYAAAALQAVSQAAAEETRQGSGAASSGAASSGARKRAAAPHASVKPPSPAELVKMEWITVPAGDYPFGEERRRIKLPEFELAKYPVTNLQYQHFLEANMLHPAPNHWRERRSPAGKQRHPVVNISLYDALAFCKWLGCRLPTEFEWEKAARGSEGWLYPWGDQWEDKKYCNNWESGFGGTTPVNKYPDGVSPFGLWDMVGNTWEWTSSEHQGQFMHVLRGGSWRLFSGYNMRATQRDWLVLSDVRDDLGFRCARSK